jgi:hypothetical protein
MQHSTPEAAGRAINADARTVNAMPDPKER